MRTHFHAEIADLEQAVVLLAKLVRDNIDMAVQSLVNQSRDKAVAAMRADHAIDLQEVRNEEACLKIIALHQPVADDLRYLIVLNKANHDLERISDLAAKIAHAGTVTSPNEQARQWSEQMAVMTQDVGDRLGRVTDALLAKDDKTARDIWLSDKEVNAQCTAMSSELRKAILAEYGAGELLFAYLSAVGHIERMADHVKNMAKDIVYLTSGEIARHRSGDFIPLAPNRKIKVLFVCVHNSARSQMAEAWLNHLHGDRFVANSAGLEPGEINPLMMAAMAEVGVDMTGHEVADVYDRLRRGEKYDFLIAVCDEAQADRCPPALGIRGEIHWTFADPAALKGSDDEKMAAIRTIRDAIRDKVAAWASSLIDEV